MKKRLGELLIECGVIDERRLQVALTYQQAQRCKLGTALVDLGFATEEDVVTALARKLGFKRAKLDMLEATPDLASALELVPRELAASRGIVPVGATRTTLCLATHDPTNLALFDELAFRTGRRVEVLIAGEREVARTVARLYYGPTAPVELEPGALEEAEYAELELELTPAWDPAAEAALPPEPDDPGLAPIRERVDAGERLVSQALERMLQGSEAQSGVSAGRLTAALVRVLTREGVVNRRDLAAELVRHA